MRVAAALARSKRIPFVEDLGSGAVVATEKLAGVEHEPTPAEALKKGVDLVCFSGDKLLGGPQAGLIAGKARLVAGLKREPFFRALRGDKLILSALQTTVDVYLEGVGQNAVPALDLLRRPQDELTARATKMAASLEGLPLSAGPGEGKAQVGGGTLPRSVVPSVTLDLRPSRLGLPELARRLRTRGTPIIGYLSGGLLKLDLRTIFPRQDEEVVRSIRSILAQGVSHA